MLRKYHIKFSIVFVEKLEKSLVKDDSFQKIENQAVENITNVDLLLT